MAEPKHILGNIFNSTCQTLVNTVNCDGVMGRGIALEFKLRFPGLFEKYKKVCEEKKLVPGKLYIWRGEEKSVLNFPTKNHWKFPSKMEYIKSGLDKFQRSYEEKKISSIAFPILGASAGGLNEEDVIDVMTEYFEPLKNIDIEIYRFNPYASDNLFDKLYQKVCRFDLDDYINHIGIKKAQAKKLTEAISSGDLATMLGIQRITGFGEKSIKKLYDFVNNDGKTIKTNSEIQLGFDLKSKK
tara:strand:- start:5632 stop:6357 length:726 start_codon:yes stop_codon:yes gene_type:complete